MNQLTSSRRFSVVFLALGLALFAFSLTVRAVTPAPDGGYSNQNTAEGDSTLFSVTTGFSDNCRRRQAILEIGRRNPHFSLATTFQTPLDKTHRHAGSTL